MTATAKPATEAVKALPTTDHATGLASDEAQLRLQSFGANAIEEVRTPRWRQLLGKLWGPVPWMLEAVIVLQVMLHRGQEALVILFLLAFNAVVAFMKSGAHRTPWRCCDGNCKSMPACCATGIGSVFRPRNSFLEMWCMCERATSSQQISRCSMVQ